MMGGKLTLAQQLIKRILLGGARAAYIDLPGTFFPQHLAADRLLVARPRDWKHALRAADILLASREWDLVAVDLTGHTHEVAPDACARLARSAADSGAVALFLHDHPTRNLGGVVSLRLQVNRKITPGGRSLRIRITKNKLAAPERDVQIPLTTGGTLCAA
jgi:RecA/RadA recombinase